ncbi:MAG: hypothetical protein ACP5HP_04365 [Thermogladius sp.]
MKIAQALDRLFSLREAVGSLSAFNELSIVVNCEGSKYDHAWLGLRVVEGSQYLLLREKYCSFIRLASSLVKYISLGGVEALESVVCGETPCHGFALVAGV